MQQGVSSCSSFMFFWFRKRTTSAKCHSSPSRKTGQIPVTFKCVFKSQWAAITSQISCKGITVLSAYCHTLVMKNLLLYIFMLKSVRRLLGVWDKVWRTQTQFTLFLFIRLLFFPAQCYSCWISLFFCYTDWGRKYSCIILKFLKCCFHFSMY